MRNIIKAITRFVFRHTIAREKAAAEYHERMLARLAGRDELYEAERNALAYDMKVRQEAAAATDREHEAWVQAQATIERIKRKAHI